MWFHRKKKNKNVIPTVNVGTPAFTNMVFRLKHGINKDNITLFDFHGFRMHRYNDQMYMLVVYSHGHNILLMIASPILKHDEWALSFCTGGWNNDHEITHIDPYHSMRSTGAGLNLISKYSPKSANGLLQMFDFLARSKRGAWLRIGA